MIFSSIGGGGGGGGGALTNRTSLLYSGGGSACPHRDLSCLLAMCSSAAVRSPIARSFAPPLPASATAARPGDGRAEDGRTAGRGEE